MRNRRVRRADPTRLHPGVRDATLTGVAGLASFGVFCRRKGIDAELKRRFAHLKDGKRVVYPMECQLRLLVDANVAGESRVFGLEALAPDPLFAHLAGGVVPSLDTVYRDLCRFDASGIAALEEMMVEQGVCSVRELGLREVHLDVDTTVESLFGSQEGALRGPNPRYHARGSYHPILAHCAEAGSCVGALLRPGDTGLGDDDGKTIGKWLRRFRMAVGGDVQVTMRIDAGGDCALIYAAAHRAGARFIGKAKLSADLCGAIQCTTKWRTVEHDAFGMPTTQVAEIDFQRESWSELGYSFRVVAMRTRERDNGKQIQLWSDLDYTVQAFVTNDPNSTPEDIAFEYDGRAEVEPVIGELKAGWGIGKVPSHSFVANHASLLLKLLAHNITRRFVRWTAPHLSSWRIPWLRRALIYVPGRLVRSGRCWALRTPPHCTVRLE